MLTFLAFVAFPELNNSIFAHHNEDKVIIETSGSNGVFIHGKCKQTTGIETIKENKRFDWVSTFMKKDEGYPYIQYSLVGEKIKLKKYSVRNGCCLYETSCSITGELFDNNCCSRLYSYSLRASNDKKTWITLHKIDNDDGFYSCVSKTFDIEDTTNAYQYFRFSLDKEYPNSKKCLQLNQVELYGDCFKIENTDFEDTSDDDDSISIIGRIKKSE